MQTTPLSEKHQALGARMVPFAGFQMPLSYGSLKEEHLAVRERVGIFDVSHMGEFIVRGKEALDFIQAVSSNDASRLKIGQAQYSCLPNERGGIVDDLIVYRLEEDQCAEGEQAFMLVVNAANIRKDWDWLQKHLHHDTRLIDISARTALIAVQGPRATDVLQPLTKIDLGAIPFYHHAKGEMAGLDNVLISATGYTGSGGFELYVAAGQAGRLWEAVMEAGAAFDIQPAGLGARDTLRLEMGYCLYGSDITDDTSPIEAGLGWITKVDKGDFPSRDLFAQQKAGGVARKLVGLTVEDRRVPRQGYVIENEAGDVIGEVTSGTQSPCLGHPIGLGYVATAQAGKGTTVYIQTGKKRFPATVLRPPFYQPV